ncbi:hypothetical protein [Stutzerimonas xanthomarina]|uniref:hypothetical protein n=1 Tax=Stutzerimonas xanthomarina TaxID=271420 RepID=UPI003AA8FBC7
MKLYLDCEFTQLTAQAKLISLGLVAEDGRELYVELLDTWRVEDCSDFVSEIVLPQLWGGEYRKTAANARSELLGFLSTFDEILEVVTDAPQYDWDLLCDLIYEDGHWPSNVRNFPIDATTLEAYQDGSALPHHALLDARIIAGMFSLPSL